MTNLDVAFSTRDNVVIAAINGEIDVSNTGALAERLLREVAPDSAGLVTDLGGVGYLDSAGVRMLFDLARRLDGARQRLAIVVPEDSPLNRLFRITQIEQAAVVSGTLDGALDELQTSA